MNGEDAEYLSRHELSEKYGGPSRDTLISLDPYTCYARIMREDGKLSRPFFFRTASPLIPDPDICIDCGACKAVCPVSAIEEEYDLTPDQEVFLEKAEEFFANR